MKHVPVIPTTQRDHKIRYQDTEIEKPASQIYLDKEPKSLKKYLKKQDKQKERLLRSYHKSYEKYSQYRATQILFIMIGIFSIVALIFWYSGIPEYFSLSLHGLVYKFTYYTLFTSLFVSFGDELSLLLLFFMLFILYFMARNIETSLGAKFLIKLYIVSCLITALFYFLLRISLIVMYPINTPIWTGLAWGGILGLLSYSLFPIMNKKITAMMYFLPMRMKGRSLLLMIIILRLFPVLFYVWYEPAYILFYLPDLGGILGAYIIYRFQFPIR